MMDAAEGLATLVDVLELSHADAQFLLQVGAPTSDQALPTENGLEIQQRCTQSNSRIL
jgi:hypothetical protein